MPISLVWASLYHTCIRNTHGSLLAALPGCLTWLPDLAAAPCPAAGKIKDFVKFDLGNLAMVTGGHNNGRVGTIVHKERHRGGHDIVHIEDAAGNRCTCWGAGWGLWCGDL